MKYNPSHFLLQIYFHYTGIFPNPIHANINFGFNLFFILLQRKRDDIRVKIMVQKPPVYIQQKIIAAKNIAQFNLFTCFLFYLPFNKQL